jgi:hypothetical protein
VHSRESKARGKGAARGWRCAPSCYVGTGSSDPLKGNGVSAMRTKEEAGPSPIRALRVWAQDDKRKASATATENSNGQGDGSAEAKRVASSLRSVGMTTKGDGKGNGDGDGDGRWHCHGEERSPVAALSRNDNERQRTARKAKRKAKRKTKREARPSNGLRGGHPEIQNIREGPRCAGGLCRSWKLPPERQRRFCGGLVVLGFG